MVIGGQEYQPTAILKLRDGLPQSRVINSYGPTEATITCSAHEIQDSELPAQIIGHPYPSVDWKIIGENESEALLGELYLGGAQLSPSAQKDCKNGWFPTGDRVRQHADGRIEFLGRTNSLVKIAGKRVDTRELAGELGKTLETRVGVKVKTASTGIDCLEVTVYGQPKIVGAALTRAVREHTCGIGVPVGIYQVGHVGLTDRGKECL